MAGKPSTANDKARAAFERSGCTLSAKELARRYKLALSTIYRAKWFAKPGDAAPGAQEINANGADV